MQVYPTTGKLRLARATPYFNNIAHAPGGGPGGLKNLDSRQDHAGMTIGVERPRLLRSYRGASYSISHSSFLVFSYFRVFVMNIFK
jgi:hypothetical protein